MEVGTGVAVGVGVSVEARNDVGLAATLTGIAGVLVGGIEGEAVGAVVDNEDGVDVGATVLPAIATAWSRSLKACPYSASSIRTLALSYNVAGFSPFKAIARVYASRASEYRPCWKNSRPSRQLSISSPNLTASSVSSNRSRALAIASSKGPVLSVPSTSASVVYSPLMIIIRSESWT